MVILEPVFWSVMRFNLILSQLTLPTSTLECLFTPDLVNSSLKSNLHVILEVVDIVISRCNVLKLISILLK